MLLCGAALASVSRRLPANAHLLERCAGILLVAGLVMLGFAFPFSD